MWKEKMGLGIMGAAALAACSPQESKQSVEETQTSSVMVEDGKGNVEILPQETVSDGIELPPQYTPEQEAEILSGTTAEVDGMSSEEIKKLTPAE